MLASISMRSSVRNECGTKDLPTRTRARYVQGVWKEEGHLSVAAHGHAWVGENSCSLWCLCGRCVREACNRVWRGIKIGGKWFWSCTSVCCGVYSKPRYSHSRAASAQDSSAHRQGDRALELDELMKAEPLVWIIADHTARLLFAPTPPRSRLLCLWSLADPP